MGGRITQKKFSTFHNRKGLKGGRQEKKGQDPEMQGTGCAICLRDILGQVP